MASVFFLALGVAVGADAAVPEFSSVVGWSLDLSSLVSVSGPGF